GGVAAALAGAGDETPARERPRRSAIANPRRRRADGDRRLECDEEDWEAFEETEFSARRASRASVSFCLAANVEHSICGVDDFGASASDCFWQPHEFEQMLMARLCDPNYETRLRRAHQIRATKTAILRLHAAGASAAALARFARVRSEWATHNALQCALNDRNFETAEAAGPLALPGARGTPVAAHWRAACAAAPPDSPDGLEAMISKADGLDAMIRKDSLTEVAASPKFDARGRPLRTRTA
ncbi:hypothetical protein M885DRAFT_551834, partial [Pelagophyceae sp. CCMP2097]